MEWLSLLLAAVLFAAACNLDTVILSMGYAVKGVRVSLSHSLIIAALTTLITWASLLLGAGAARVLSGPQASTISRWTNAARQASWCSTRRAPTPMR